MNRVLCSTSHMTSFKTLVLKSKVLPCDKSQDKLGLTRPSLKGQNFICEPLAGEAKWCSSRSRTRTHNCCCDSDLRQWGQTGSTERISSGLPFQMRTFSLNKTRIFQIQMPTHRKSTNWGPPRVPAPTSLWRVSALETRPSHQKLAPITQQSAHTATATLGGSDHQPCRTNWFPVQQQTFPALTAPASLHTNTLL